jgi:Fic family protein
MSSPLRATFTSRDATEKSRLEARNYLLQFDEVVRLVQAANGVLQITPAIVRTLHRSAIQDIYACAGNFRIGNVAISHSLHVPPPAPDVSGFVDEMCAYANASTDRTPVHTAAYLLWRMNWVHPFNGGNGRTARALAYLALSIRLGCVLPGTNTIIAQLMANRPIYVCACHHADALYGIGQINVGSMEFILSQMLGHQLGGLFQAAITTPPPLPAPAANQQAAPPAP